MTKTIYCYSEQALSPRAADTLKEIIAQVFPGENITLAPHTSVKTGEAILVFGNSLPEGFTGDAVFTYSIAQMMSKPNAGTVVGEAMLNYVGIGNASRLPEHRERIRLTNISIHSLGFRLDEPIAIDIETGGALGESHTPDEVEITSIAFYQDGVSVVLERYPDYDFLDQYQLDDLAELLPQIDKGIYQNGKFDLRVLNRVLKLKLSMYFDTMLAHHTLNHAAGEHGLEALVKRYFGRDDWKNSVKQYVKNGYEGIPTDILSLYNGTDVYWTMMLHDLFKPQIDADPEFLRNFKLEMDYSDFLLKVEKVGIPFDYSYVSELIEIHEDRMAEELEVLKHVTDNEKFNPNSPKQVKEWLHENRAFVSKTDVDSIKPLEEHSDSDISTFAKALLKYRKSVKIVSTYAKGWSKHARNGRVHPTFQIHGTTTGRLSSRDPNAQNMPRDPEVRRMVSVQDSVIINVDLSQAELRVMAALSGDEWMLNALQLGQGDFFDEHLMPVSFPHIVEKYGSISAYKEADPKNHKEDRTKVKAVQYGLAFGRQAPAIARSLGMSVREAEAIIENYFDVAPNFKQWRVDVMEAAVTPSKRDFLVSPFGRHFQSEIITTRNQANIEREALSFLPQSTSSDICLVTCVRLFDGLESMGYKIFNVVHDAIMIEGPAFFADKVGEYVGEELTKSGYEVFGDTVPFLSDYSIGKSWADLS